MVSQTETLHGNERIQQLMEAFPELPKQVIIKADYVREGVRHTPILDQVGKWAIPDVHDSMEYDYDEHSHSQEEVAGGHVLIPRSMYLRTGAAFQMMFRSTSPYEVKYEGRGSFWLYRDDDPLEEVHFAPCPQWYRKTTSSGNPMSSVMSLRGERNLFLMISNYCEHFRDGNQCLYCNINPSAESLAELGQERVLVKREQDIYETYLACAGETGVDSIAISAGGFSSPKKEADMFVRIYEVVKRAMRDSGCVVPFGAGPQAMDEENQLRFKEVGAGDIRHRLEVWDAKLFPIICPGKARYMPREDWIEALLRGVKIFGWGRASTNFVLGVELAQPFGFKTEDEAYESNMEGWRFLLSHGVRVGYTPWQNRPWSKLAHLQPPRVEYILRMDIALHKLLKEFDLLPTKARGTQPPLLGEHGGNGDWVADLPETAIWPPALRA